MSTFQLLMVFFYWNVLNRFPFFYILSFDFKFWYFVSINKQLLRTFSIQDFSSAVLYVKATIKNKRNAVQYYRSRVQWNFSFFRTESCSSPSNYSSSVESIAKKYEKNINVNPVFKKRSKANTKRFVIIDIQMHMIASCRHDLVKSRPHQIHLPNILTCLRFEGETIDGT